jgi:hypothetical protein
MPGRPLPHCQHHERSPHENARRGNRRRGFTGSLDKIRNRGEYPDDDGHTGNASGQERQTGRLARRRQQHEYDGNDREGAQSDRERERVAESLDHGRLPGDSEKGTPAQPSQAFWRTVDRDRVDPDPGVNHHASPVLLDQSWRGDGVSSRSERCGPGRSRPTESTAPVSAAPSASPTAPCGQPVQTQIGQEENRVLPRLSRQCRTR